MLWIVILKYRERQRKSHDLAADVTVGRRLAERTGSAGGRSERLVFVGGLLSDGAKRLFLHQEEERRMPGKKKKFRQMIEKRGQRIPLEYILGYTEFMGLKFEVDSHVLIPRQDTECLVEQVLPFCPGKKVLDLCTGSGCIGISLAVLGGPAAVVLADVSGEALKVAEKNAENHGVKPVFCQGDLFENVPADLFDVIVSNPPYIASEEIQKLMPEVQDHEPVLALDGREDGLFFTEKL